MAVAFGVFGGSSRKRDPRTKRKGKTEKTRYIYSKYRYGAIINPVERMTRISWLIMRRRWTLKRNWKSNRILAKSISENFSTK